jgi:division protein CdvB (Snf7/Vps24/ESCRT-III family)
LPSFYSNWSDKKSKNTLHREGEGIKEKLLDNIRTSEPLRTRLEKTQRKLEMQISKMDNTSNKLKEKDNRVFNNVTEALQNHNMQQARSLSSELSQIRRINKVVDSTRMTTEQVKIRLETVTELGDVMFTLGPATSTIKTLKGGLSEVIPNADQSLNEISNTLGELLNGTIATPTNVLESAASYSDSSEEIDKILEEASAIVGENSTNRIPDIPSSLSFNKQYFNSSSNKLNSSNGRSDDTFSSY